MGRPRGMVWGGRREEGSGWGTHVYLWRIHFDIWQNQYNILHELKFTVLPAKEQLFIHILCSPHLIHGQLCPSPPNTPSSLIISSGQRPLGKRITDWVLPTWGFLSLSSTCSVLQPRPRLRSGPGLRTSRHKTRQTGYKRGIINK